MPVIQARYGDDTCAVGRFILDRAKSLGLSRTDLVRRFGYRKLNSGHAALSEFLKTGIVPSFVEGKLADVLEIEQDILNAVLVSNARQLHDEACARTLAKEAAYRAVFRPHLQVQTEGRNPSPIFVAALLTTSRLRIVPLPDDISAGSEVTRDRLIKATILEHHDEHRGRVPAFGGITGYVLVLLPGYDGVDFGLPFDVCGDPAGSMREVRDCLRPHSEPSAVTPGSPGCSRTPLYVSSR